MDAAVPPVTADPGLARRRDDGLRFVRTLEQTPGKDGVVGKHLLDETAEFAMPRKGRHASPDTGELEIAELDTTQRIELSSERHAPQPPRSDEAPPGALTG